MSDLIVHHLGGAWGLPTVSPFCPKLDAFLRMTEIPHKAVIAATPFAAPKRKAPWIEHEGKTIGDSGFIIDYLRKRFKVDPDADLTASQRAIAHATRRLIEENLYWTMVHDRWMVDRNWTVFRDVVLGGVPIPIRHLLAPVARRGVRRQLRGHGMGLHTEAEIHEIGCRDVAALADILGDKPHFMGDQATEIDAIVYGQLVNIMNAPISSPIKDAALQHKNLVEFLARFGRRYFERG